MYPSTRDLRFDNLKGIMIFLVVFCHSIEQFSPGWPQQEVLRWLYCCVYSFHMPVFIFCSGYFSKGTSGQNDSVKRAIAGCFVPYFAFQVFYSLLYYRSTSHLTLDLLQLFNFTSPQWTLWYLLSLFFWRIFAEPFSMLRWPMVISLALSIYIGTTDAGEFLSIARTFSFFPFFLAGYMLSSADFDRLRMKSRWSAGISFAAAMAAMTCFAHAHIDIGYLRMSQPYEEFGDPIWNAMLIRAILLGIGFVCIFSLITIMWERPTLLSSFGRHSLPIYLFHAGLLRLLATSGWIRLSGVIPSLLGAGITALILCFMFGNEVVHAFCASILRSVERALLKPGPPAKTE